MTITDAQIGDRITVSGEWELTADDDRQYEVAFVGILTARWSGGVGWKATRNVAEAVAARQDEHRAASGLTSLDRLHFEGDTLVLETDDDPENPERIDPDADGLYTMPGWSWYEVDPGEATLVHTPSSKREVLVHLNVEVPDDDTRTADEIADALLAALAVGSDDDSVRDLEVCCPLAEDA